MPTSALAQQQHLLVFIVAGAALALLLSEGLVLWFRRREPATDAITAFGRLFWALTPAAVLVGLSIWCASELAPPPLRAPAGAVAWSEAAAVDGPAR
jgi:hypothetical protein